MKNYDWWETMFFVKWKMDFEIEEEALSIYYFICSCNNMIKKIEDQEKEKEINLGQRMASWKKYKRNSSFHTKRVKVDRF